MISIDLEASQNRFIIKGELSPILNKPRVKANFRSIGAEAIQDGRLAIPYQNKADQEIKYQQLQKLLDKFNITEISKTDAAAAEIQHIDRDINRFKDFSRKALNIRNNEHQPEDFKGFSETVRSRLTRTLTTLQLLSAYHLAFSQNACNFSVPGAGKTTVVYAAFAFLNSLASDREKFIDKIIVIGPLSSFLPWRVEYKECFGQWPKCKELVGISEQGRRDYFSQIDKPLLTLISYPSASSSSRDIISYLKRRNDRVMVVLDEAHRIKNTEGGRWATEILNIAPYADARVILTGTPAPNGYEDLHNLFKFIWPSKKIISLYEAKNITKNPDSAAGKEQLKNLIADISPFFIRVTKKDLNLPKPIENKPQIVPMDQKQAAIYEYMKNRLLPKIDRKYEGDTVAKRLAKARLVRLMQSATNVHLLLKPLQEHMYYEGSIISEAEDDDQLLAGMVKEYASSDTVPPKFVACKELLNSFLKLPGPEGKVIVWSNFIHNIDSLSNYLKSQGINNEVLYGATPVETERDQDGMKTREQIITRFHDAQSPHKVIIANPYAVGESISLHHACRNAIYLDRNYNATPFIQSKDRIHRYGLGKDAKVNYHYLVSKGSIDLAIHEALSYKEERMKVLIESEEILLFKVYKNEEEEFNADIAELIKIYHAEQHS